MPQSLLNSEAHDFSVDEKNLPCYPLVVQVGLFFVLAFLCFLSCGRDLFNSPNLNYSFDEKLDRLHSLKLDLNEAGFGELAQIPGIGKSIASEIIRYRQAYGRFKDVNEIGKVKGIGQKTADKLINHLYVGSEFALEFEKTERIIASLKTGDAKNNILDKGFIAAEKIDPNQATFEELKKLPGIGEMLATRIVEKRRGMVFRSEKDLQKVSGIGKKTAAKIAPFLKFPLISQ